MTDIMDTHGHLISPEPNSGCWLWVGSTTGKGLYGKLMLKGVLVQAHRHSWALIFGPIPEGMLVCHHCDIGLCVNPDHLFVGTHKDNADDMFAKGRHDVKGESIGSCKLSVRQVLRIREDKRTQVVIAAEYGMSPTQVGAIRRRQKWGWL